MSKRLLRKILILEFVIASLALVFIFVAMWNKPLGPVLGLPTATAQKVAVLPGPAGVVPVGSIAIAGPTPTPQSLLAQIVSKLTKPAATSGASLRRSSRDDPVVDWVR